MDLSCLPNRLDYPPYDFLPGQEMHETPQGDLSQDLRVHRPRRSRAPGPQRSAEQETL